MDETPALVSRPRHPCPPLPDREKAMQFFEQLASFCKEHGYTLGRSTWVAPDRGIAHFEVEILEL